MINIVRYYVKFEYFLLSFSRLAAKNLCHPKYLFQDCLSFNIFYVKFLTISAYILIQIFHLFQVFIIITRLRTKTVKLITSSPTDSHLNLSSSNTNLNLRQNYSVYFLKGKDDRLLNIQQQKQVLAIMEKSSLNTSILLYNSEEVKRKYKNWTQRLPWIKMHYAIKANPTVPLLQDLIEEGSNFDCASRAQITTLLQLGVKVDQIVYSNSIKDEEDLLWANSQGVKLTTSDTIDQLVKLKKYAPSIGILWRISIKEEATDNLSTPFSGKFGDDLETSEQIQLRMRQIQNMGISLKGIHFHCGSGQQGSSAFGRAITLARQCIRVGRQFDHQMSILDIGGGFPAGELPQKTIQALRITENDALNYKVYAQPGRHICANAFYLLTRVLGKRVKAGKTCYHLNESLYHSFNCNLMDDVSFQNSDQFYGCIDSATQDEKQFSEKHNATLFGMTCDGMDVIAKNIEVPKNLTVSDWLCFSGMGAYTYGSKSTFNGMKATDKVIRFVASVHKETEVSSLYREQVQNLIQAFSYMKMAIN